MTEDLQGPLITLPAADEIEVSLFGPGTGESCVIHLGLGQWLIVDSCRARNDRRQPAALSYLRSLGVSIRDSVVALVATHWHDDHISGMAETFQEAASAEFYFSSAVRIDELEAFVKDRTTASRFKSGANELAAVKSISRRDGMERVLHPVAVNTRIWSSPRHPITEVWALSPSSTDQLLAWEHIGGELARRNNSPTYGQLADLDPNDASVVLLLKSIYGPILLGADLEHQKNIRTRGWHAVRDSVDGPIQARIFKVPHHGSSNADCPEVWEHEIAQDAICLVAPFGKGTSPPPQPDDVARIRQHRSRSYLTSNRRGLPVRRDRVAQKSISESTRSFVPNTLQGGHLQVRVGRSGDVDVRGSFEACVL